MPLKPPAEITDHQLSCIFEHIHIARQSEVGRTAAEAARFGTCLPDPKSASPQVCVCTAGAMHALGMRGKCNVL